MAINGTVTATGKSTLAVLLTNGNFETGTIDPWLSYDTGGGTVSIDAAFAHDGDYGVQLYGTAEPPLSFLAMVYQEELDLTSATGIKFDYRVNYASNATTRSINVTLETGELGSTNVATLAVGATTDWITRYATIPTDYKLSDVDLYFTTPLVETTDFFIGYQVFIDNVYKVSPDGPTYIQDTSKSFTPDEHVGRTITMTSGTAIGQSGTISTNTASILYLSSSFPIQNVTAGSGGEGTSIETWETGDLNNWLFKDPGDETYISVSTDQAHTGTYSIKIVRFPV